MAFATTTDVGNRLGKTLAPTEIDNAQFLLDMAEGKILEAAGRDAAWAAALAAVPVGLTEMTTRLVCRAMANPNDLARLSEQIGSFNYSAGYRADVYGLSLTAQEEREVRKIVWGVNTASPRIESGLAEDVYADEVGPLEWIT